MWPFLVLLACLGLPALTAVYRPPSCNTSEFACADGACVSLDRLCDGARDCADGSDEQACALTSYKSDPRDLILHRYTRQSECRANQFRCRDGTCISFDGKCDGVVDCPDRSDETHALCRKMPCQSNLFHCTYGACVDGTAACNNIQECADNSDELAPRCRTEVRVSNGKFKCTSGQEIPSTDMCDGAANCADASDESLEACADMRCAYSHLFQCAYGACVDAGADCDNKQDCYDGSDESDELCNRTTTTTHTPLNICILPSYPDNGRYDVPGSPTAKPGSALDSVVLSVSCDRGYAPRGSQYVECRNGVWLNDMAQCVRYCELKSHQSVTYLCGPEVECGPTVLAGSTVTPICKTPNYYSDELDVNMKCLDKGFFDKVTVCKPGITSITVSVNGIQYQISTTIFALAGIKGVPFIIAPVVIVTPEIGTHVAPLEAVMVTHTIPVVASQAELPVKVPVTDTKEFTYSNIVTPVTPNNYNEVFSNDDYEISEDYWRFGSDDAKIIEKGKAKNKLQQIHSKITKNPITLR